MMSTLTLLLFCGFANRLVTAAYTIVDPPESDRSYSTGSHADAKSSMISSKTGWLMCNNGWKTCVGTWNPKGHSVTLDLKKDQKIVGIITKMCTKGTVACGGHVTKWTIKVTTEAGVTNDVGTVDGVKFPSGWSYDESFKSMFTKPVTGRRVQFIVDSASNWAGGRFGLLIEEAPSSCTASTWGSIDLATLGTATINLGASTDTASTHVGLHIPAINYTYANCIADHEVEIKAYKYNASTKSCDTTKPISGLTFDTRSFAASGQETKLTTGIKVNGPNIAALETSDNAANPTNSLIICLKATVKHILFTEDVLSVSYKPNLAFKGPSAASVEMTRAGAEIKVATTANPAGDLTVFRCDNDRVAYASGSAPAIDQGSPVVRICVHGQSLAVQCDKFWAVVLTQDLTNNKPGSTAETRVSSGTIPSAFTMITSMSGKEDVGPKSARHKGCVFEALLTSSYFQTASPGAVSVTGDVLVSFKTARGRRLRDGRQLDDDIHDDEVEAPFKIDMPLTGTTEMQVLNGAARTSFVAAGIIAAAAAQCIA